MAKMYFAEVRNIMDPMKSGRVQIRKYTRHDDEQQVKDDELPWAMPLQPITSAATGRVGVVPVGMLKGSRVLITYSEDDTSEQYPIIIGTFSRAGDAKDK